MLYSFRFPRLISLYLYLYILSSLVLNDRHVTHVYSI